MFKVKGIRALGIVNMKWRLLAYETMHHDDAGQG